MNQGVTQTKTRTVYQAGYVDGVNRNWRSCGTGSTPDEARKSLADRVHRKGLQWVANYYKSHSDDRATTEDVVSLYESGRLYAISGQYTEQSYEEQIGR